MTPERWQEVKELLGAALEMEPAERTPFLERACVHDSVLRGEVERLLAVDDRAETEFLKDPAIAGSWDETVEEPADAWIGRRVGPYKIVEQIGVGGMGEVYRAVRADDQYQKQVALKVVRAGQDSGFVISRFKNERQILASLDHPNIARLYDGGTTEDGVPYFVMELIDGQPVDQYCGQHQLPVTERLNLFLQVCSAVQYAHQRLIIHRDIKPSNILVTSDGTPKLLDFGIAKILGTEAVTGQFEPTLTIFQVLTPGYASPEQLKGEPITTASDVYSLGVVLYELLTGQHPYRKPNSTPQEIVRAVCEVEPERPSTAVKRMETRQGRRDPQGSSAVAEVLDRPAEKLSKPLRGDLDNIVLMVLRKEPQRRYASVEQFAEDIRRHLQSLPVVACRDTVGYRTSKFITRHKAGVTAAILVMVTLLVAMATTLRQARIAREQRARAEQRFNDVRKLANSLLFDLSDGVRFLPGSTDVQKRLIDTALRYLDSLAQEAQGDPALQRELAAAYKRLGDIQGAPASGSNLGDSAAALASYRKALALRQGFTSARSSVADQIDLAASYRRIGQLLMTMEKREEAEKNVSAALAITRALLSAAPDNPKALMERANGFTAQAAIEANDLGNGGTENPELALQSRRQALDAIKRVAELQPDNIVAREGVAYFEDQVGSTLVQIGKNSDGVAHLSQALAILEGLASQVDLSANAVLQSQLSATYSQLGVADLFAGRSKQALANYQKEFAAAKEASDRDPHNAGLRVGLGIAYVDVGTTMMSCGRPKEAIAFLQRGIEIAERQAAADPNDWSIPAIAVSGYVSKGEAMQKLSDQPGALAAYRQALKLNGPLSPAPQESATVRLNRAAVRTKIASALAMLGNFDEAEREYEEALAMIEASANAQPSNQQADYTAAEAYAGLGELSSLRAAKESQPSRREGQWKVARAWYQKSLATWRRIPAPQAFTPNVFQAMDATRVERQLAVCDQRLAKKAAFP